MKYQELVNVYEALGATTKRLEKTDILADFFKTVDGEDLQKITLMALGSVFPPWSEEEPQTGQRPLQRSCKGRKRRSQKDSPRVVMAVLSAPCTSHMASRFCIV